MMIRGEGLSSLDLNTNPDDMTVTGNLGYIKPGVHSSYDPDSDSAIDTIDENKIEYITFYFDVKREILAFMTVPILSVEKILDTFSRLIKKESEIGVEFIQESNLDDLKNELRKFSKLSKLEVKLVPPNGDKEDFAALFSLSTEKLEESGSTKVTQAFQTQKKVGLNMHSALVEDTISGVILGYAEAKFSGKDKSEEGIEVSTSKKAPYTKYVNQNETKSHSIVSEKGRAGVANILEYKAKLRLKMKNENKK